MFIYQSSLHRTKLLLLLLNNGIVGVINVIFIYGLITTQIQIVTMHENYFNNKSTETTKQTMVMMILSDLSTAFNVKENPTSSAGNFSPTTTATTTTTRKTTTTTTTAITPFISLQNRPSSAVFMSDDFTDNIDINSTNHKCTNVNVNNFQMVKEGRGAYETNCSNMKIHFLQKQEGEEEQQQQRQQRHQQTTLNGRRRRIIKRKRRWIRDLWAMTATNATELTSTTTTTKEIKTKAKAIGAQNNSFVVFPPKLTKSEYNSNSNGLQLSQQQQQKWATKNKNDNNKTTTSAMKQLCQQHCKEEPRILSRPKRFLTFPEGASFSVALCITIGIIGNPRFNYMAFGLNWGVAYDLPNASWVINHLHGFSRHPVPASVLKRRTRRSLYREIEDFVDNMGHNGRECVLRALCESKQYFRRNKMSMIGEMLRVIFSLPKQRLFTRELHENSDIELYDRAYRRTRDSTGCSEQYDCSFSLLELAFGKYSTPPPGYYQ